MSIKWVSIYSSSMIYKVEIMQALLLEHGIESIIVNKQDSAYFFGDIELHVHPDDVVRALQIIKKKKL